MSEAKRIHAAHKIAPATSTSTSEGRGEANPGDAVCHTVGCFLHYDHLGLCDTQAATMHAPSSEPAEPVLPDLPDPREVVRLLAVATKRDLPPLAGLSQSHPSVVAAYESEPVDAVSSDPTDTSIVRVPLEVRVEALRSAVTLLGYQHRTVATRESALETAEAFVRWIMEGTR